MPKLELPCLSPLKSGRKLFWAGRVCWISRIRTMSQTPISGLSQGGSSVWKHLLMATVQFVLRKSPRLPAWNLSQMHCFLPPPTQPRHDFTKIQKHKLGSTHKCWVAEVWASLKPKGHTCSREVPGVQYSGSGHPQTVRHSVLMCTYQHIDTSIHITKK